MKVLMIGQLPVEAGGTYTNGVCNVVYELSKCAPKDIELVVYATNMKEKKAYSTNNCLYRGTKLRPFMLLLHIFSHPLMSLREWRYSIKYCRMSPFRLECYRDNIERLIIEETPDIIHCMNLMQMHSTHYANARYGIPIILTLHGCDTSKDGLDAAVIHMSDYVTGLTPRTLKEISTHGINKDRVFMVPNGTDTSKFYFSQLERTKLRSVLGISDETTLLITIGSLCHRKGQYSFLKVIKDFPNEYNFLYLIIGNGPDENIINSYIRDNNLDNRVRVLGYVNNMELYRYHSAADVYVHSSRSEGQALSEVEAYATDLKIAVNNDVKDTVITDITDINDYFLFDIDNFDKSAFIKWSLQHKNDRKTKHLYDWKEIFKMYGEIYIKIAK